MNARVWMVAVSALAVASLAACGKDASSSAADFQKQRENIVARQRQAPPTPLDAQASPMGENAEAGDIVAVAYRYDPLGKRDPFRSFVLESMKDDKETAKGPLEQFELQQLKVLGVVWETNNRRALVADPSGRAYIVGEGDPIGKNDGEIIGIEDNLVLVKETYEDYVGERSTKEIELRVRQAQGG